jgi:hypothetical protein
MNLKNIEFPKLLKMEKVATPKRAIKINQEINRRLDVARCLNRNLLDRYNNMMDQSKNNL